jgi:arylsulfatase A-like enzyme
MSAAPTRRDLLGAALATASLPAWGAEQRPNLLFICLDQLGAEALGHEGNPWVSTPNLDALAARSLRFPRSYTADPACAPARAAWYSGRPSNESGVLLNRQPLRADLPDIGQWLGDRAGYTAVHAGKWHLTRRSPQQGFRMLHPGGPSAQVVDAGVVRAMESFFSHHRGRPFFAVASLINPHDICLWWSRYGQGKGVELGIAEQELPPLPANFLVDFEEPALVRQLKRSNGGWRKWSEQRWRQWSWVYYRHVEMVDAAVGRILEALARSAHADRTVVLLSADHGEGNGRHATVMKQTFYEESVRVPFLLEVPGRPGATRRELVSGLDLVPTLCDYAGVEPPPLSRGRSLRPLVEGRSEGWRTYVQAQSEVEGRMICSARYKYIAYRGDPVEQLFDLQEDPAETRNLAGQASLAGVLRQHRVWGAEAEDALDPVPDSLRPRAELGETGKVDL